MDLNMFKVLNRLSLLLISVCYISCYNISELLSSRERITSLIEENLKKDKSTGYNIAKIKLANEVIIELIDKGTRKEHGDEILRLICEYTVGMNENSLDLVSLKDMRNMFKVYEDIYSYGKPPFIDHKCDTAAMEARFSWEEGPVTYFNYVRKDANDAWKYFSEQFKTVKDKLANTYVG